jgi:hypothetical protein
LKAEQAPVGVGMLDARASHKPFHLIEIRDGGHVRQKGEQRITPRLPRKTETARFYQGFTAHFL